MKIKIKNIDYKIDPKEIDISIPVEFNSKKNPKFHDEDNPVNTFYKYEKLEYNINKNGSCNVPIIKMNIHCSGTHTETANHIIQNAPTINDIENFNFIPSQLISINPEPINNEYGEIGGRIILQATTETWIQLQDESRSAIETRILHKGDRYYLSGKDITYLMTSNIGGLNIIVDGLLIPPMGNIGELKRDIRLNPNSLLNLR